MHGRRRMQLPVTTSRRRAASSTLSGTAFTVLCRRGLEAPRCCEPPPSKCRTHHAMPSMVNMGSPNEELVSQARQDLIAFHTERSESAVS